MVIRETQHELRPAADFRPEGKRESIRAHTHAQTHARTDGRERVLDSNTDSRINRHSLRPPPAYLHISVPKIL